MSLNIIMKGGKLLSEGGYGCVFFPSINCDGTSIKTKKYVSKIQKFDKSAKNEIKIGKKIKEIRTYNLFFVPVLKYCKVDVGSIEDKDINKCTILKKNTTKNYVVMKIKYIKGFPFLDYIIKNKNNSQILRNIINSFNHLLLCLEKLISRNIIHYDLKSENIMFNINLELPHILDFGISIDLSTFDFSTIDSKLRKAFYVYAPEYYTWPLEVHYMSYLLHESEDPSNDALLDMASRYVEGNKGLTKNFSPEFLEKFEIRCYEQLVYYKSLGLQKALEKILSYWKTFDNYSLSIVFLKLINYINIEGYIKNNFIIFLTKLLLQNIDPNPERRLSIKETTHAYNGFLYKKEINDENIFEEVKELFVNNKAAINDQLDLERKIERQETITIKKFLKNL